MSPILTHFDRNFNHYHFRVGKVRPHYFQHHINITEQKERLENAYFTHFPTKMSVIQTQYLPAKGMTELLQTVSKVKRSINPNIQIDGILLTLVDNRTNLAKSTVEAIRNNFGSRFKIYQTMIPSAVKAAEVSSKGKSIYAYEPNSSVSKAYTEFTKEVLADGRTKERLLSANAR